jgi:hypothetical protein
VAIVIFNARAIDPDGPMPAGFQTFVIGRQIDGKAAASRRLAADGAITELIGVRRVTLDREMYRAAPTRPFQYFRQ